MKDLLKTERETQQMLVDAFKRIGFGIEEQ